MIRYTPFLLSVACAEFSVEEDVGSAQYDAEADTGVFDGPNDEVSSTGTLRIDVYAESATDPGLLNQTFLVESNDTADLGLFLEQPIAIAQNPGNEVPLDLFQIVFHVLALEIETGCTLQPGCGCVACSEGAHQVSAWLSSHQHR